MSGIPRPNNQRIVLTPTSIVLAVIQTTLNLYPFDFGGGAQQIVGRERRERVSQLARCGAGCFDARRRVNSDVGALHSYMRRLLSTLLFLLVATSACSALRHRGTGGFAAVRPVKVEGIAMEPALKDGDRIFIDQNVDPLQRGDIVIFYYAADPTKSYIKRIVSLPVDAVEIRGGKALINRTDM